MKVQRRLWCKRTWQRVLFIVLPPIVISSFLTVLVVCSRSKRLNITFILLFYLHVRGWGACLTAHVCAHSRMSVLRPEVGVRYILLF